MYSYRSPHMAAQKQDDQLERTFSSYVRIQVVVLKTYLGRWTIGRSGERGSGISVLPARYDDDDDWRLNLLTIMSQSSMLTTTTKGLPSFFLLVVQVRPVYFKKYHNPVSWKCQNSNFSTIGSSKVAQFCNFCQ